MHLNLLPASTRLLIQFDQQLRIYLKVWMVIGFFAFIYFTHQLIACHDAQRKLTELDIQCEPARQLQKEILAKRQSLAKWQTRKTTLASLQSSTQPVAVLGAIVQSIAAQPGKVHLQRISVQLDQGNVPPPQGAPNNAKAVAPIQRQSIVLMGQAEDDTSLSQLIMDMQRLGSLDKVDLKSSSRTTNSQTRQFHIEAWHTLSSQPTLFKPIEIQ